MTGASSSDEQLSHDYRIALLALHAIAERYFFDGRLGDALHLLGNAQSLLAAPEVPLRSRLALALLNGRVLIVDHFLNRGEAAPVFAAIEGAAQLAAASDDQRGIADAASLLGQARYFVTVVAARKNNTPLNGAPGDGMYDAALADQQRALELREALGDTRGISESCFQLGVIYERWGQYERALGYYGRARALADRYNHAFEKTEPARHVAFAALREGKLDRALTLAEEALALREAAGFRLYQPLDHLLIRDVALARGDLAQAQRSGERAMELAHVLGLQQLVSSYLAQRPTPATQQAKQPSQIAQ